MSRSPRCGDARCDVLHVVAVPQRVAVAGRKQAAGPDPGGQTLGRSERQRVQFDVTDPADGVVERYVEGGDGQCRRSAQQADRQGNLGGVRHRSGARRLRGATLPPIWGRNRGGRPGPAFGQPPARGRGEPPNEPSPGVQPAHMARFGPYPGRHGGRIASPPVRCRPAQRSRARNNPVRRSRRIRRQRGLGWQFGKESAADRRRWREEAGAGPLQDDLLALQAHEEAMASSV